ncbi:Ig-like domain-containing protein, partial [Holdemanella porci]|uniref:Ig-like domain-containing protein n=1 Tax=Holdemanella porci TaxID=2652276 RepID=UPI003F8E60C8
MLKNLKKVAAIVLSFAMAVQFGLADSYYVNAVEEPVEPQQQEETTTTTPQEQEQVPTTEEETPQQQEEGQQQPAVEEEQPAAEEAQQQPAVEEEQPATEEAQPQPVEQAKVNVSYVKEDDTDLMESVTATYDVGYRLDQDTNVFKEAHEAFEFEYAFVNGNKENKITKDQVKASGLTVTSDMTSLTLVYKSTATQKDSKDKKVEKANFSGKKEDDSDSDSEEKNISVASDTDTTRTIKVGETITLTSKDVDEYEIYNHNWTVEDGSKVKLNKTSGVSITVTGLKEGTTTVTDTYRIYNRRTKTYTITVNAAVTPTGISISGADKVTQFQTTQLTANLTPADANGKVTWTSSNEEILSVDENGLVTGNRQGSATITASVQGADKNTLSATKTIEVVKNERPSGNNRQEALVYYLKDPTKDANSNGSDQWGPDPIGTAIVNVEGATWAGNRNCFDNVDQRVLSWPTALNGTNVVPRSNNAWNLIFNAYKASIEKELKVTITRDDVEEITLVPAKISKNNGTDPDMHLDCNVNIKCKRVALIKYYLFDANGTNWEMLGSKNYLVKNESTTQPSDVTSKEFPTTKKVNGVTYTFSGWYTDQSLTTPAPSFPAKVTGSVTYYAKYVAGYQVTYNLAGGQFSDGSTLATEQHNVDTDVVVKEAPPRKGYKFTGWTVVGLDGTNTINSGDRFTMPNGNVTLTANWQEQKIAEYITLTPTDVIKPYDGKTYKAGIATVSSKTTSPIPTDLKIEYSVDGNTWTTNPSTITATNVSDSKTVKVRVSSDNYTGKLEGTEELTITPAAVTVTITGNTKTDTYDETEKTVTGYTFEKTNELYRDADFGLKDGAKAEAKGTNAGTYQMGLTEDSFENKNANFKVTFEVTDGWLKIDKNEAAVTVTITGNTKNDTYDETEKTVEGYTTAVEGAKDSEVNVELKDGAKAEAKGTDAKTYQMGLTEDSFTVTSNNYENINVVVVDGSLTITPAAVTVTITGNTKTDTYDETEKTVTGYTFEKTNE